PGDYEVMRFIYELPFEGQTLFGKSICLMFNETRASRAVHHRKDLVKRRLRTLIESRRRPLRILSVAAGPAQELFELLQEIEDIPEPLEIVLFEQDKGALAYAYGRLRPRAHRQHVPGQPQPLVHGAPPRMELDLPLARGAARGRRTRGAPRQAADPRGGERRESIRGDLQGMMRRWPVAFETRWQQWLLDRNRRRFGTGL